MLDLTMFNFFSEFHLPTFFITFVVFILISSVWNLIKAYMLKSKAEARVKESDKKLEELMQKLNSEDRKIDALIKKFERPTR